MCGVIYREDRKQSDSTVDTVRKKAYRLKCNIGNSITHLRLTKYRYESVFECVQSIWSICDLNPSMAANFFLSIFRQRKENDSNYSRINILIVHTQATDWANLILYVSDFF